jgi:two-component system cell cycle sensor histidine kinase/response regulator CckA
VLSAGDGNEATKISEVHTGQIHLMVTDVIMPSMSGRELADHFQVRRPDMRVLYISGYTSDAIVDHGVLAENIAFLEKPFTPAAIARKVRELLDS